MIITTLTYKKPFSEAINHLEDHYDFLDQFYVKKLFLASGGSDNRVGGVILVLSNDLEEAEEIMKLDPFFKYGIADYNFHRFNPTKYLENIKDLI